MEQSRSESWFATPSASREDDALIVIGNGCGVQYKQGICLRIYLLYYFMEYAYDKTLLSG